MSRPRMNDTITAENVLLHMTPGKVYAAFRIAEYLHAATAEIRPLLDQMVADRQLELAPVNARCMGFRRPECVSAPIEDTAVTTSVATARTFVRLDGELIGYDAEFARRAALCMMVRPR